jgi:hypothetical protein
MLVLELSIIGDTEFQIRYVPATPGLMRFMGQLMLNCRNESRPDGLDSG